MPPSILCRRNESTRPRDAKSFILVAGQRPRPIAPSRAWVAYDDDFVYAMFDFDEPLAARLPRAEPDPPPLPWSVDSAELSIWSPRRALMYKFIVTSLGRPWARAYKLLTRRDPVHRGSVLHDWREREPAVSGWEPSARKGRHSWEARMKIPWRVLGSRKPQTGLAVLFGRNRCVKHEQSSWPPAFHFVFGGALDRFAALRLESPNESRSLGSLCLRAKMLSAPVIRPAPIRSTEIIIARDAGMFPVAQKLADGSIGVVARDGAGHVGLNGYLRFWRSTDDGKSWSAPTVITDGGQRADHRNPAFGQMADGALVAAYWEADDSYGADGRYNPKLREGRLPIVSVRRSTDLGRTWSAARPLVLPRDERLLSPFGKIVVLSDGTALMPVYNAGSRLVRSRDNGRTWGDVSLVHRDFNETALLALPSGRLLAALRGRPGSLWITESADGGYAWSEPRQLAGEAQVPGDLIRLQTGEVILVHGYRHFPYGVRVMVSLDDGRTWRPRKSLPIVWWAQGTDCGYPSSVELSGGRILTTYYAVRSRRDLTLGIFVGGVIYKKTDLLKAL